MHKQTYVDLIESVLSLLWKNKSQFFGVSWYSIWTVDNQSKGMKRKLTHQK